LRSIAHVARRGSSARTAAARSICRMVIGSRVTPMLGGALASGSTMSWCRGSITTRS
jgi:hypothetical protein